jgi:hypothetical protein
MDILKHQNRPSYNFIQSLPVLILGVLDLHVSHLNPIIIRRTYVAVWKLVKNIRVTDISIVGKRNIKKMIVD